MKVIFEPSPWVIEATRPLVVRCHGSCAQIAWHESLGAASPLAALLDAIEDHGLRRASRVATCSSANATYWRERLGRDVAVIAPAQPLLERAIGEVTQWLVLARVHPP